MSAITIMKAVHYKRHNPEAYMMYTMLKSLQHIIAELRWPERRQAEHHYYRNRTTCMHRNRKPSNSFLNPLTPVPAVTGSAKTHPQFPVPAITGRKKPVRTIAFPTLPEDVLVLLLFYRC